MDVMGNKLERVSVDERHLGRVRSGGEWERLGIVIEKRNRQMKKTQTVFRQHTG